MTRMRGSPGVAATITAFRLTEKREALTLALVSLQRISVRPDIVFVVARAAVAADQAPMMRYPRPQGGADELRPTSVARAAQIWLRSGTRMLRVRTFGPAPNLAAVLAHDLRSFLHKDDLAGVGHHIALGYA